MRERTYENYGKYANVHGEKRARAKLTSVCGSVGGPKQINLQYLNVPHCRFVSVSDGTTSRTERISVVSIFEHALAVQYPAGNRSCLDPGSDTPPLQH